MTNFSAWVSGNGKRSKSKMAARYREKRTLITTVRDQYLSSATFPTPLIFHYPLPLKGPKHEIFESGFFTQIRPVRVYDLGTGEKNAISQVGAFIWRLSLRISYKAYAQHALIYQNNFKIAPKKGVWDALGSLIKGSGKILNKFLCFKIFMVV